MWQKAYDNLTLYQREGRNDRKYHHKASVQKRFDRFMAHGRVLFFSAPCGFGKTVLADALLRGRNVLRQSAADPDCAIPPSAQDWDILLIDDLQFMQEEAGQQALCELIRSVRSAISCCSRAVCRPAA